MRKHWVLKLLDEHGVGYRIAKGKIWADKALSNGNVEYDDVTSYTLSRLLNWLGY